MCVMYVYARIRICTYMYVGPIHDFMYVIHVCMEHTYVCMYACMHVYVCMYVCMHACMQVGR